MLTYCLSCRKKTDSIQPVIKKSGNKTHEKSKCSVCGKGKSRFIKSQKGGSLLNDGLKSLKTELHLIDQGDNGKIRKMSFCGPGTNLNKRLKSDNTPHDWSAPINDLDKGCLKHDLVYRDYKDVKNRNIGDDKLYYSAKNVFTNPNSRYIQRATATGVMGAMATKSKLQI